jgi:hypothetical protein
VAGFAAKDIADGWKQLLGIIPENILVLIFDRF